MRRNVLVFVVVVLVASMFAGCGSSDEPDRASNREPSGQGVSLRLGTVTERSVDGGADGRNATAAVTAMNEFSVDLYRQVTSTEDGNIILSPYSAAFALSMIYAGARGSTETEMADVLHATGIDQADWHEGINAYDLTLEARTVDSSTDWASANKVWTTPGLQLIDNYLDILTGDYGSPLAEADFVTDPEGARDAINTWVKDNTNDLIPGLWPPNSFDANTVMVLVNAVALDAPWEFPFDAEWTRDGPFTLPDGTTVRVPMMQYHEYLPSYAETGLQAVELPYGDGALSMIVIVPDDLAAFEADLSTDTLDKIIDGIKEGGIHLSMPKWSARTDLELDDSLTALGMQAAFTNADFSGMVQGGGIHLETVQHSAFIEVDEEGTRAAAATGGAMAGSHGPTIDVNKPFLYLITDRGAGTYLFMGRVDDPTETAE